MRWSKHKAPGQIREVGLVPIVRAPSAEDALLAAEAIVAGNIGIAEITMTVPNAIKVLDKVAISSVTRFCWAPARFLTLRLAAPHCWQERNSLSPPRSISRSLRWPADTAGPAYLGRLRRRKSLRRGKRARTW